MIRVMSSNGVFCRVRYSRISRRCRSRTSFIARSSIRVPEYDMVDTYLYIYMFIYVHIYIEIYIYIYISLSLL